MQDAYEEEEGAHVATILDVIFQIFETVEIGFKKDISYVCIGNTQVHGH